MNRMLALLAIVMLVAVGCEQKVENQGNFAKTDEFFKEMETPGGNAANAEVPDMAPAAGETVMTGPAAGSTLDSSLPAVPTVKDIQQALANAGLYQGKIDGAMGPKTKEAVKQFQSNNNLKIDGKVGPMTWSQLKMYLAQPSTTGSATQAPSAAYD